MSDIDDNNKENDNWNEFLNPDKDKDKDAWPDFPKGESEEVMIDDIGAKSESKTEDKSKQQSNNDYSPFGKNCIYYKTNTDPDRWIGGTEDNRLVEFELKVRMTEGIITSQRYIMTRSFTTCKPLKMVKHKNMLSFLDLPQRYTMQFKGEEASGSFTIKHKTLSEISGQLRDGNALTESGIDIALQTQIKAFEKAKLLEENDDMHFIGFFTNENRTVIIPSEVEFKEIDNAKLTEALNYINELAEFGYSGRLDLLAHTIKFGIIAPCSFIFKYIKSAWLEWMDLYGKPNASKSTSGKIILAIDGHDKEEEYSVNMGHVDTIARLGETIGATTFPKLVDEMDFNDDKKLVSNVKMAISNTILRIVLDRYRRKETILALSALIMTSNSEPPKESGFRKRLAIRYFPDNEIHFKDAEDSKKFDALLTNLNKLQALGDFRNKFIMENQDMILNKYMTPFEKALKIIIAAYEQTGVTLPDWLLNGELVQNPLEETIGDNAVYIRHAFETYIQTNFRNALQIWQRTESPEDLALLPSKTDAILMKLLESNKLVDIKRRPSDGKIIIYRSLINELYKHEVNSEQLPNLRALADSIGAKYGVYHGNKVAIIEGGKLSEYFDNVYNEDSGDT